MTYLKALNTKAWLTGRITLYKIKFAETDNNNYLDTMNNYNETLKLVRFLEDKMKEINDQNIEMRNELNKLKS